jgi:hypothetical protein
MSEKKKEEQNKQKDDSATPDYSKIDPFEIVEKSGQMDLILDLYSGAETRFSEADRQAIKEDVKKLTGPLSGMIVMVQDLVNDPEKLEAFYNELRRQQSRVPSKKPKKDKQGE